MLQLNLWRKITVDNFAGGGGMSDGYERATGLNVDIAINHDEAAIRMHKMNHPDTTHYCESVWDVNPNEVVKGQQVGLCWLSPDCTHHSKAKGGKPVKQNIRGLAWIGVKWAIAVRPDVIMLENVEEFKDWGPIDGAGKPIKDLRGQTFESFVKALESLGYEVDYRELQACDYGAPTTRKRFFLIARCDRKEIVWPVKTHAHPQSLEVQKGLKKPWVSAAEIIDWSIPAQSIFSRKKPLVENTLKRIAKGLQKFVIESETPFIIEDKAHYLMSYYTEQSEKEVRGLSLDSPLHTITAGGNRFALVTCFLAKYYGQGCAQDITEPLHTITAGGVKFGLVSAFLIKYYGQSNAQSLNEPLHTITTKDRFGLVTIKSEQYQIVDIGLRMLKPHELYAAQGFREDYKFTHYEDGTPIKHAEQIKRVGNSVPPQFVEALVRTNLPEMCAGSRRAVGI